MAKMGRPRSDAPKRHSLSVRVTDQELQKLKDYADGHGMTITQLLYAGVGQLLRMPDVVDEAFQTEYEVLQNGNRI